MVEPSNNDGVSLWQDRAKCISLNPESFFTETDKQAQVNKLLCIGCPVIKACLEYALIYEMSGVWGGTTDKDRRNVSPITKAMLRDDAMESGVYKYGLRKAQ